MNGFRRELTNREIASTADDGGETFFDVPNLRDHQVNYGITEDALDDIIYRPRFSSTELMADGASGTAMAFVAGSASPFMAYPNAGTPTARMSYMTPRSFWINGAVALRIIWSGDTASTANLVWQYNVALTVLNGVPASITGPSAAVPGPSVIGALQDYTFAPVPATFAITAQVIHVGLSLFRLPGDARDTYAGEGRIHSFQLIYQPAAGH